MSSLDLIGRIAARRLRDTTDSRHSRPFFCILGLDAAIVSAISSHVAAETSPGGGAEVCVCFDDKSGE
ncbi:hypothetical protein [Mesorhizobium sp. WSM3224]|uniref:hypothetical protein n=1 Tax=Mesorhizobium sp. WSM3224 TaxID=1040986 RepID=UPI000403F05A|nr:hypothetical protein [Mesorhizobium sp. WSM3224]